MKQNLTDRTAYGKILRVAAYLALALVLACGCPLQARAAEGYDSVAPAAEAAGASAVEKYGMVPIHGIDVKDGTYPISVISSSSFFHIDEAELTVKDGEMQADMTLSSISYKFLFPGTAEEAAKADLEEYIPAVDEEGRSTFHIEVAALDQAIDCAAFSKKKKAWYDRKILFDASSLPEGALAIDLPDYDRIEEAMKRYDEENGTDSAEPAETAGSGASGSEPQEASSEPVPIDLKDGEYSIQVNMTGGSGRAGVTSPTWLIVKDGKAYAKLLWSSTYYDYMIVGGEKYLNETTDGGNSTFTIPITKMDAPVPVIADTTAMGDPVEIEYTLTFYEGSVSDKNKIPQEAAINVLIIAVIIIVVGGILNFILKRRKKQ